MNKLLLITLTSIFLCSCASSVRFNGKYNMNNQSGNSNKNNVKAQAGAIFRGQASFYNDKYDGRKTASGEIFDQDEFTAAHRTLNFGTKCKVTNLKNGKSVEVIINDRGPFIEGRIIDLSKAAAEAIGMINDGVADVEVLILE